jgi:hypothetical protein
MRPQEVRPHFHRPYPSSRFAVMRRGFPVEQDRVNHQRFWLGTDRIVGSLVFGDPVWGVEIPRLGTDPGLR